MDTKFDEITLVTDDVTHTLATSNQPLPAGTFWTGNAPVIQTSAKLWVFPVGSVLTRFKGCVCVCKCDLFMWISVHFIGSPLEASEFVNHHHQVITKSFLWGWEFIHRRRDMYRWKEADRVTRWMEMEVCVASTTVSMAAAWEGMRPERKRWRGWKWQPMAALVSEEIVWSSSWNR